MCGGGSVALCNLVVAYCSVASRVSGGHVHTLHVLVEYNGELYEQQRTVQLQIPQGL